MNNYKELQELIKIYEKTNIWKYINGDDIFRLEGFEEKIYVSIMGKTGIEKSIAIYYGKEDLRSQLDLVCGPFVNFPDTHLRFNAFKIEVGKPGNMLFDYDKNLLKKNKIKAKNVVFRLNSGNLPRIVNEKEAKVLIDILKRIIEVSEYIIKNNLKLVDFRTDKMYSFKKENNEITAKKVKYPTFSIKYIIQEKPSEEMLNKSYWISTKIDIKIGHFYAPMYVYETNSYPQMIIIENAKEQTIIDVFIISDDELDLISNKILESFINKKILPSRITFNCDEIAFMCEDLVKELEIEFDIDYDIYEMFNMWQELYHNI